MNKDRKRTKKWGILKAKEFHKGGYDPEQCQMPDISHI